MVSSGCLILSLNCWSLELLYLDFEFSGHGVPVAHILDHQQLVLQALSAVLLPAIDFGSQIVPTAAQPDKPGVPAIALQIGREHINDISEMIY